MSEETDPIYLEAMRQLVTFKLIEGNIKLLLITSDKEWLDKVQKNLQQRYPDKKYKLENFGVRIVRKTISREIAKWKKTEGEYSLWEEIGSRLAEN